MAYEAFKAERWSDGILENLDKKLVFGALANREYEADQTVKYGSSIVISEVGNVAVSDYAGTVNYEELDDASKTIKINQRSYAGVSVDDADAIQANPALKSKLMGRIAYGMANKLDTFMASLYSEAGLTVTGTSSVPVSVTSANIISLFTGANRELDEADVPTEGRVAVISPWIKEKMILAKILKDTDNTRTIENGYVGNYLGFEIYVSNNTPHSGTTWTAPMFFIKGMTLAFVSQLDKIETLRDKDSFGDYMRALDVYGGKVLYPATLAIAYVSQGAETTI